MDPMPGVWQQHSRAWVVGRWCGRARSEQTCDKDGAS